MKYKWLLLDADGTLFDYDRAEAVALESAFVHFQLGFQAEYAQVYRRINKEIWLAYERGEISQQRLRARRFGLLFEAIDVDLDPVVFSEKYLAYLAEGTYLIEGAEKVVQSLHDRGVGLVLITNGMQEVQRHRVAKSAIGGYFADLVVSGEVGVFKPDRRIFEIALERMGSPKNEDVLIVGDSLTSDIRGGNVAGIDTCWFNPTQQACDQDVEIQYEIRRLDELLTIVAPV